MLVFRIGKTAFANDLTGEGAKLYGGRWNHPGIPCIYTSGSRGLALLEYCANVPIKLMPSSISFTTLIIPDDAIEKAKLSSLPVNWVANPHLPASRDYGNLFILQKKHLVLQVPSSIILEEFNYIINPLHPRMKEVKIQSVTKYPFDKRLKN